MQYFYKCYVFVNSLQCYGCEKRQQCHGCEKKATVLWLWKIGHSAMVVKNRPRFIQLFTQVIVVINFIIRFDKPIICFKSCFYRCISQCIWYTWNKKTNKKQTNGVISSAVFYISNPLLSLEHWNIYFRLFHCSNLKSSNFVLIQC